MKRKLCGVTAWLVVFTSILTASAQAQSVDNSRYPYRVPDWLWTDANRAHLISPTLRLELEKEIKIQKALADIDPAAADKKGEMIARKLGMALCLRDLTWDTTPLTNQAHGMKLSVHVDPSFAEPVQRLLLVAAERFLSCALQEEVIARALRESIPDPQPFPAKYEMKDGKPALDPDGKPVLTEEYKFYLSNRSKPRDADSFKSHLRGALHGSNGDPALLVISRYTGNAWWGGGYYNFYHEPVQQLRREAPPRKFLSIRINSDRFAKGELGAGDPDLWASKIGHELLHNLGYWHPDYQDTADRDKNNQGDRKAFIVAYELSVYHYLKNRSKQ